jgi:hypothetical protein
MNASTCTCESSPSVQSLNAPAGTANRRPAPFYRAKQLGKQEADQAFEAGVKWFLEVSRRV